MAYPLLGPTKWFVTDRLVLTPLQLEDVPTIQKLFPKSKCAQVEFIDKNVDHSR